MRRLDGHDWQSDLERRAAARCLGDLDRAAMSADKSMADRQPDTRSAANRLRCEERLKHPRAQTGLNARPVVTNNKPQLRLQACIVCAQ